MNPTLKTAAWKSKLTFKLPWGKAAYYAGRLLTPFERGARSMADPKKTWSHLVENSPRYAQYAGSATMVGGLGFVGYHTLKPVRPAQQGDDDLVGHLGEYSPRAMLEQQYLQYQGGQ